MRRARRLALLALAGLASLGPFRAGLGTGLPDTIARVKPALVAVGTFQRTRNPAFQSAGTGFAVGDGLTIVTNAHVVAGALNEQALEQRAVASSERGSATVREVRLVALDMAHDLAILRLVGGTPYPTLMLADPDQEVREGQDVALSGYPLSTVLGVYPVTHRGIVAAQVPIVIPAERARQLEPRLVRQLGSGAFRVLQLDVTAYPGNSGSPVYDPVSAQVLGVVNSVFVKGSRENALSTPTGITYAIPVRHVIDLLKEAR